MSVRHRKGRNKAAYLFMAPYLALALIFGVVPAVYSVVLAFSTNTDSGRDLSSPTLENFSTAYGDFRFLPALENVSKFVVLSVVPGTLMVLILAMVLHTKKSKLTAVYRTTYFLPAAVAGVPAILIALIFMTPRLSPAKPIYDVIGWTSATEVVTPTSLPVLFAIVTFFSGAGLWVTIFYGALNGISSTVTEASRLDRANAWHLARFIKYPHLRPYLIYMGVLVFAGNLQLVAEPELLGASKIAPIPPQWSLNQLAFEYAFGLGNFSAAAVLSLSMLGVSMIAAYVVFRLTDFFTIDA